MKVLFYALFNTFTSPFAYMLQSIRDEQDKGNEVYILKCNGQLKSCHANPNHSIIKCATCQSRVDRFVSIMDIPPKNVINFKSEDLAINFQSPVIYNTNDLLNVKYDGVEIGRGVASNIISKYRDFDISTEKYKKLLDLQFNIAINVYENIKDCALNLKPDKMYVYNGRQAEDRPLVLVGEKFKIDYVTYVSGSDYDKVRKFNNAVVHRLNPVKSHILSTLELAAEERIITYGSKWFEENRSGKVTNYKIYTQDQTYGSLPHNFDKRKQNIAIFNSSEDEFKTFDDWRTNLYGDQNEAIKKIVDHFKDNKNIHFYLRVHPNLSKVLNRQIDEIRSFNFLNLTVIDSNSNVDTYALIENTSKSITFGSTTGAEATFWGKPSILYGVSYYDHLDITYNPKSLDELEALVCNINLIPKPKSNAIKYGYYIAENGEKLQNIQFKSQNEIYFNDKIISIYGFDYFKYCIKYLPKILLWFRMTKFWKNL